MEQERWMGKQNEPGFRLSDFSIRYPVTICMIFLSFLALGGISISKIPLVMLPEVNAPFIVVNIPYYNATPEQVQETITRPIEEALSTIPNIERITSYSNPNNAYIQVYFGWGADMDWLRSEVREKVEQARADLPADVEHMYVQNYSTNEIPILGGRIASGRDLRGSYDFLNVKIKQPLERVPGVGSVEIHGVDRKEVDVFLRLDDLKRYRVEVDSLFRRMSGANLDVSLGKVVEGGTRYGVITRGSLASLDQIRDFPVKAGGLTLKDIAEVSYTDPEVDFGRRLNGSFAISLDVRKTSDANTVETVQRLRAKIDELNQDPALAGVQVLLWHDAGREITRSLSGLFYAGTLGALLSVLVLFLFLRKVGATLAIGFAIPFSIISAIGFLYIMGNTLNVLSMMGLMLSTGMLVDNAVVVLESIFQQLEKGRDRVTAARIGTREVLTAVVASTLTTVIIFVPLVFGKKTEYSIWLGHTGTAIIITLLCSLFVSLTLIPLGVARLIRVQVNSRTPSRFSKQLQSLRNIACRLSLRRRRPAGSESDSVAPLSCGKGGPVLRNYLRVVGWSLRHRYLTGLLLVPALIGSSFLVLMRLPDNSPEAEGLKDISIEYEFSENYKFTKVEQNFVKPVEDFLLANRERFKIDNIYSYFGNNQASTRLFFDESKITLNDLKEIRKQIAEGLPVIPGAEIRAGRQEGAQNNNWIGVNLYGDDSLTLQQLASEARRRLKSKPDFSEVHTSADRGREEVQITLNRQVAKSFGVSPQSVSGVLGVVLRGRELGGFRTSEGEVKLWVKLRPEDRRNLEDLKSLVVGSGPDDQEILLSQVASFSLAKTPSTIRREDRRTYDSLYANYAGAKKEDGKKLVSEVMDELAYPPGYGWSYGFWTKRREQENRDFFFNLVLALFMVYFVMASLFESLAHPFAIMLSLLFAFVGVAWFLLLTGTPFNLMAMIGLMILIGIVVNNGIVLLDHINNLRRKGAARMDAILNGCQERFRPILMTATTTIVGLIPLALGTSGILGLRYFPMARTVMGGLLASTVLTLIVLPTYYYLLDDLAIWLRRVWFASSPQAILPSRETERCQ
jgi:hydrophobic/amphiphilic exporter-1 (mainly G- bacteria), HAE1 family